MTTKAVALHANGVVVAIDLEDGLKARQEAVGGYIEAVQITEDVHGWINEEGKYSPDCEPNALASLICKMHGAIAINDYIAGSMILVGTLNGSGESDGEDHDVPASVLKAFEDDLTASKVVAEWLGIGLSRIFPFTPTRFAGAHA